MNVEEQIKILCVKLDISVSELGRKLNKSPQAFTQKIKRNSLTVDELKEIAAAVNCEYKGVFILPNHEEIEY